MLADDHPIVREGLQRILEGQSDVQVLASVGDGSAAIRAATTLKPDVVIMDITMPGMDGIEATRVIVATMPSVAVLMLSMHASPIVVRRALDAGALGYLVKDASPEDVLHAVRTVAEGKHYVGQNIAQTMLDVHRPGKCATGALELLTTTERNILRLVAEGKTNVEMAVTLGLSARTVETYRLRLMCKLSIDNLPSLVRYAILHGIIALE